MEQAPAETPEPTLSATRWGVPCLPNAFDVDSQNQSCLSRDAGCSKAALEWRRRIQSARLAKVNAAKPVDKDKPVACSSVRCMPIGKMVLPLTSGIVKGNDASASDTTTTGKDGESAGSTPAETRRVTATQSARILELLEEKAHLQSEIGRISGLNAVIRRSLLSARISNGDAEALNIGHIDVAGLSKVLNGLEEDESDDDDLFLPLGSLTRLASDMEGEDDVEEIMQQEIDEDVDDHAEVVSSRRLTVMKRTRQSHRYKKVILLLLAIILPIAILVTRSTQWDKPYRLGIRPPPSEMVLHTAYALAAAGLIALMVSVLEQPLILGYLLGGVLVGDRIGLKLVPDYEEISEFSSLGLVFLLFMIGLELDVRELLKMGKVVLLTGLFQFPVCAGTHFGIFTVLELLGLTFGTGDYTTLYVAMSCGISSTMIVVKILAEMADMDSKSGRLTVGILIFQDIWAIVVLAIQPDLQNPQPLVILKTFGMIAVLLCVALMYAKFVMPVVFVKSSRRPDLMLVLGLAWCFLLGCFAILPFIGLSLELASLISGVALATFPYSAEFTGKIKYIRDFFLTLFFVGLGMQIPIPQVEVLCKALLVALVVLGVRWLGIFVVVYVLGGGTRLAAVSTINLSQVSEFALVICSLGMKYEHVHEDTLTILIWTFVFLAILASYMIGYNYRIYGLLFGRCIKRRKERECGREISSRTIGDEMLTTTTGSPGEEDLQDGEDHPDRTIVILGFHKVAAMLLAHMEKHSPQILPRMHVVDRNESIFPQIRAKGVTCSYGDISSPDVLEHAFHGEPQLVLCSIPDNMLQSVTKVNGCTNVRMLQVAKSVWPAADVIATADNPTQARELYEAGADYVLRMSKLCAHRLSELAIEHQNHAHHHAGGRAFRGHRQKDEAEMLHPRHLIRLSQSYGDLDQRAR